MYKLTTIIHEVLCAYWVHIFGKLLHHFHQTFTEPATRMYKNTHVYQIAKHKLQNVIESK